MPESTRAELFCQIDPEEMADAQALTAKISDKQTLYQLLGEPDHLVNWATRQMDFERRGLEGHVVDEAWDYQYSYWRKWRTLDLTVTSYPDGRMAFAFSAKHKDRAKENGIDSGRRKWWKLW